MSINRCMDRQTEQRQTAQHRYRLPFCLCRVEAPDPRSALPSEAGRSAQPGAQGRPPYLPLGSRSGATDRGPGAQWPARLAANQPACELPDAGRRSGGLSGGVGVRALPALAAPSLSRQAQLDLWALGCARLPTAASSRLYSCPLLTARWLLPGP